MTRILLFIAITFVPSFALGDGVQVETTAEGTTIVFDGPKPAKFELPPGKGLLGPSANPSSQEPFVNGAHTIYAVNHQPMTKTSYVCVFLRKPSGEMIALKDVNKQIRRLFPASFTKVEPTFIRVESIAGDILALQSVYDFVSNPRGKFDFRVKISPEGALSLVQSSQ